jgi:hypothetical protein
MRTHCKAGHPVENGGRCQVCDNETRQRRNAKRLGDGLTPQERLKKTRLGWKWPVNYYSARTEARDTYGQ